VAYALRAAQADASYPQAWWALTGAGIGLAVCTNAAVLSSW
jgi:hypothetical protein